MITSWIVPVAVGETFERYEIEALLGRGGWSEVYRAVDTRLRRKVALKILRPDKDNPDAVARLFREARAAAGLTHPNTVAIHDIGEAEGIFYIVMELVSGSPLLAYVGDVRVSLPRRLAWLRGMALALSAAHKAGVIHRDVKPSNVMVSDDDIVKVLDFGLAKPLAPASFRTQQGHVLGTPRYMAPEQGMGAEVDARCDQYSFGITAWELLAGVHPGGILSANPVPAPLHEKTRDVPVTVSQVFVRVLATDPHDRYPTMDDVVVALDDAVAGRTPRIAGGAPEAAQQASRSSEEEASTVSSPELVDVDGSSAQASADTLRATNAAAAAALQISQRSTNGKSQRLREGAPPAEMAKTLSAAEPAPVTTLMSRGAPKGAAKASHSTATATEEIVAPAPRTRQVAPKTAEESVTRVPATRSEGRESRKLTLAIVGIVVLGACAFAGAYFASKEVSKPRPDAPSAAPGRR